jgi:hypothetical protein
VPFCKPCFERKRVQAWLFCLAALTAAIGGESAVRMESDDPGLQFETGVESGELREIDVGGRSESAAKRPKQAGGVFLPSPAP